MEAECNLIDISDDEDVARCAIFPRIFPEGVFSIEAVIAPLDKAPAGFALSVGSRKMLPAESDVHVYGCRVAELKRTAKAARFEQDGRTFQRPGDSDHYRGFYDLPVSGVRQLSQAAQCYDLDVVHCPEAGQNEHCEIRLNERGIQSTKKERSSDRTTIIAELMRLLKDPKEHICDCDTDLRELLEPIRLLDPYRD